MKIRDLVKLNTRVSAVYALGVWTMIGSYGYLKYTGRLGDSKEQIEFEEDQEEPNKKIYQSDHVKSIVVHKENFVPYTTRIYTYVTSLMDETKSGK